MRTYLTVAGDRWADKAGGEDAGLGGLRSTDGQRRGVAAGVSINVETNCSDRADYCAVTRLGRRGQVQIAGPSITDTKPRSLQRSHIFTPFLHR